jgi:hypothetical protein
MKLKDELKRFGCFAIPYLIIFIASLLPFYIYFHDGIPWGDDMEWHLIYCYDLYYGFKNGFVGVTTNHLLMGVYAYDTYLFYGPFPHYFVVILTLMFEWAGLTIITAMKITTVLSVFVSGIFVYFLGKAITKSKALGTIAGVAYVMVPYRVFCFLYRAAFSEAIALCFIPMVFYGLYRILNDEHPKIAPFVFVVVGMSSLVLSHPFTALVTSLAAVIYIVFNIKKVIRIFRRWQTAVACAVSILLIVGLVAFYFFPLLSAIQSGLYHISDSDAMWTNLSWIKYWFAKATSSAYSGFLNFVWLDNLVASGTLTTGENSATLAWSLVVFVVSCILCILTDFGLKKTNSKAWYRFLLDFLALAVISLVWWQRLEIYLALGLFYLVFLFVMLNRETKYDGSLEAVSVSTLLKNPDIYFLLLSMSGILVLLYCKDAWDYVPSIFYECQFPYRLWGLFGFLAVFLAIYVFSLFRKKPYAIAGAGLIACLLLTLQQGVIDKRISYETGAGFATSVDESTCMSATQIGVMNEYVPEVFYDDDYVSEYPSTSLYSSVKSRIRNKTGFLFGIDEYPTPAVLTGEATVTITSLNTPDATFEITVTGTGDALIQLPQFYYDGYRISLSSSEVEAVDVDGLVAFTIPDQGVYDVSVSYVGSSAYQVGSALFAVSVPLLVLFGAFGSVYFSRLRKKEEDALASAK